MSTRSTSSPAVAGKTLQALVEAGLDRLPLPGAGRTLERWQALARTAREDVTTGRLLEAHTDALAILAELGGPAPPGGSTWGVWAAEPPQHRVTATRDGDTLVLQGTKAWCSGAGILSHALVTTSEGLVAVDLSAATVLDTRWTWPGLTGSATSTVDLTGVRVPPQAQLGDGYLRRPGFWWGAIGVAAVWYGAAAGVAEPLRKARDAHARAHLGEADAALAGAAATLRDAAARVDAGDAGERDARRARAVVEQAADTVLRAVARGAGPSPLVSDERHARRVLDLTVYLRQSHAERDLEALATQPDLGWDL